MRPLLLLSDIQFLFNCTYLIFQYSIVGFRVNYILIFLHARSKIPPSADFVNTSSPFSRPSETRKSLLEAKQVNGKK
jgi:hypothetical protein